MAQTKAGARRIAAGRLGVTVLEYEEKLAAGLKHCGICRAWLARPYFSGDSSRVDGLASCCRDCVSARARSKYQPVPPEKRLPMGPAPHPERGGDKKQARGRVSTLVRNGTLPPQASVPCVDCGHIGDDRRHEYDHFNGYGQGAHTVVEVVCSVCHHQRDNARARQTHCIRGHPFDEVNTGYPKEGGRFCKACRRDYDKKRKRPEGHWQAIYQRRKARKNAANV